VNLSIPGTALRRPHPRFSILKNWIQFEYLKQGPNKNSVCLISTHVPEAQTAVWLCLLEQYRSKQ